jgi:hypothetical protein
MCLAKLQIYRWLVKLGQLNAVTIYIVVTLPNAIRVLHIRPKKNPRRSEDF